MSFSQSPNITVSVDVFTELKPSVSSLQGDITCCPGQGVSGEEAELLLDPATEGTFITKGYSSSGALFFLATATEAGVSAGPFLTLPSPPSESWLWVPGPCCGMQEVAWVITAAGFLARRGPLLQIFAGIALALPVFCLRLLRDALWASCTRSGASAPRVTQQVAGAWTPQRMVLQPCGGGGPRQVVARTNGHWVTVGSYGKGGSPSVVGLGAPGRCVWGVWGPGLRWILRCWPHLHQCHPRCPWDPVVAVEALVEAGALGNIATSLHWG